MADLRQSKKYSEYLQRIGWKIEKVGSNFAFFKSAPFVGSIMKVQRPSEIDLDALFYISKKNKTLQSIIEPKTKKEARILEKAGFKKTKSPYLPTKTLHLDLTKTLEQLYQQVQKDTRYYLRKTKDLKVYSIDDVKSFRQSWKMSVDYRRWIPPTKQLEAKLEVFKKNVQFLTTPSGDTGAIFIHSKDTAYYWQAFTGNEGRKTFSQYKIVWTGIVWAKKRGAKTFDFEGIYDKRFPNEKWKGFTHFKKSFGGYEVEYPGAYIKYLLPF